MLLIECLRLQSRFLTIERITAIRDNSNANSSVVDIGVTGDAGTGIPNLTLVAGATAADTPDSYGWVRFKSIVQ